MKTISYRRISLWLLAVAVGIGFLFPGRNPALAITAPAKIAFVKGNVEIFRRGSNTPVPAEIGISIFYGDGVKTENGWCQINMTASGILRLPPHTIVWFPTEEKKSDRVSVWNMLAGESPQNLRMVFGLEEKNEFKTPRLVAGRDEMVWPPSRSADPDRQDAMRQELKKEIERLRSEGNAKLDAIRAELKQLEGKPVFFRCAACGSNGPHRWTVDGWECNCGATAVSFGDYPTSQGAYNKVRDEYRRRIEEIERQIR